MQRIATLCLQLCLACAILQAQDSNRKVEADKARGAATTTTSSSSTPAPTVNQILEKFVQAQGGKEALGRPSTRVLKGRYETSLGPAGTIEIYTKAPNKILTIINIQPLGVVRDGFDGVTAWRQDPSNKISEKTGSELALAKLEADFYRSAKLGQLYPSLRLVGVEKVGERDAYLLEAALVEGSPEKLYFEVQTGLLVKRVSERDSSLGKMLYETLFEDYREVDGIKIPFLVRRSSPAASVTFKYEEVKCNLPIADEIFNKPLVQ